MTDDQVLDRILEREGGFVWHKADPGGPTNMGITQSTLASWRGKPVTSEDVHRLTRAEAKDIYRARYLAPFREAPDTLKPQLVDIAVLSGVGTALTLWERAGDSPVKLAKERLLNLARIVKQKPTLSVFIEGWVRRAINFIPE